MNFDFAALLVFLTFLSGVVWLLDTLFFAGARQARADLESGGIDEEVKDNAKAEEPWPVEYARSFFPIFLIVLLLRSFVVEPFRIPSASMMPTLLIGDFILVNKFDYGLRLPVLNNKVAENKTPSRGDIVVFRYPDDPKIPYIKRIIGLPGDHLAYADKNLYINGALIEDKELGQYNAYGSGLPMMGSVLKQEYLGDLQHEILEMPNRPSVRLETVVPEGHYFVLGDNRDNSKDSRYWGFVPDENLVGRAFMIWMNWDGKNGGIEWKRIGTILE